MNSPQLPPQRSVSIDQTEFDAALGYGQHYRIALVGRIASPLHSPSCLKVLLPLEGVRWDLRSNAIRLQDDLLPVAPWWVVRLSGRSPLLVTIDGPAISRIGSNRAARSQGHRL